MIIKKIIQERHSNLKTRYENGGKYYEFIKELLIL